MLYNKFFQIGFIREFLRIYTSAALFILSINLVAQPKHDSWTELLKKHVDQNSWVNYAGMTKDSHQLNKYLSTLSKNPPSGSWSTDEVKAYWINAYNAFTVQLMIRNPNVKSIKEIGGKIPFINSSWDIKFIKIGKETYDLNNIEHGILRKKYDDPRLHMALVCASKSCPVLRNEAYDANKLNAQLDEQCRIFLNDQERNKVHPDRAYLSKIFSWYSSDFNGKKGLRSFVNKYSATEITSRTKIEYLDYDWGINGYY